MHVLVAAHDLYPDPGSGGTGRYVYETARRLADRGHRVSVITRRRGDRPLVGTVAGIDVRRYDLEVAGRSAPAIAAQLPDAARTVSAHVAELARRGSPDVLSYQGPVTSWLVERAVDDAVPRTCTFHSPWPTEYAIKTRPEDRFEPRRRLNVGVRKAVEGRLLSRVERGTVLSEFMCERLERRYDPPFDPAVVPGGVDVDRFVPDAPAHERIAGEGTAFLTVRRLTPRMGHGLLLRAFARVADDRPDAHLYVAGDGELRGDLERLAGRLGIVDRTTFLGYVPDERLPGAYAAADAFVLPTTELEGFGLATLEALASGTPVVATPVGATPEVLGGLDDDPAVPRRTVAEAAEPEALAALLGEWAALPSDERERAGERCRRYVRENYTWERTVDELEGFYGAIASERRSDAAPPTTAAPPLRSGDR